VISSLLTVTVVSGIAVVSAGVYLLPVLIGWARRVPDLGAVAVIDIMLGWTFLGWVVALAMAFRSADQASPVVHLVQNLQPPSPPPSAQPRNTGWAGPPLPPAPRPGSAPPLTLPPRPAEPGGPAVREHQP
jgi:Superinfection immunity protein